MRPTPRRLCTRRLLLCLPALALLGGPGRAQEKSQPSVLSQQETLPLAILPPPEAPPPPAPCPTFAQALAALEPPRQDLFLTVGADKITLPPDAPPPDPADRPGAVGETYGRLLRDFGGVTALAPPEMVTLNTRPGVPDPYDGMPPDEAFKLLVSTLAEDQWRMLTGEAGLGDADLITDAQHADFAALFPTGEVTANEFSVAYVPALNLPPVKLNGPDLKAARLRLVQQVQVTIPLEGRAGGRAGGIGYPNASLDSARNWYLGFNSGERPADAPVYGAAFRETLLNRPKEADLDYDAPILKRSLRLDGIATVGDLIARVGRGAGLELYADRRYEARRVTLLGRRTARAVDLLRAVAFCVTGTFRRVGPAYVLTDDREGVAPRRLRLWRFVQEAAMKRHTAVTAAGDSLWTVRGGLDALPSFDGLGLSAAQRALPGYSHDLTSGGLDLPSDRLTPAQQEFARHQVERVNRAASPGGFRLALAGAFSLRAEPRLLLLSPAVPGPVVFLSGVPLYQPSTKLMAEDNERERLEAVEAARKREEAAPKAAPFLPYTEEGRAMYPNGWSLGRGKPGITALLPLKTLMASLPRRAFLARPRTVADVDSVVASMKRLGLNQLWLDVFSGGRAHLDPDILAEALARTAGTGIAVIPALDLLRWGADAPAGALDRTALGETYAQDAAWQRHFGDVLADAPAGGTVPPAEAWVSPAAPGVEDTLTALVRRLAATPGVTTLALRGTVPPGDGLGYVPALRLALLRRAHTDPLDLSSEPALAGADVSLPEFEDAPAVTQAWQDWGRLRDDTSRDLLRRLLTAAREASGHRTRFLVQQRGQSWAGDWYGLWDDGEAPLPGATTVPPPPLPGGEPWERDYARAAHAQCRVAMTVLGSPSLGSRYDLAADLQFLPPGWDGVVLDVYNDPAGDPLAALARTVKP